MASTRKLTPQKPGEQAAAVPDADPVTAKITTTAHTPEEGAKKGKTKGDKVDPAVLNRSAEVIRPGEIPDQTAIDPASIPYGQRVLSKQGWVCSTQDPPARKTR